MSCDNAFLSSYIQYSREKNMKKILLAGLLSGIAPLNAMAEMHKLSGLYAGTFLNSSVLEIKAQGLTFEGSRETGFGLNLGYNLEFINAFMLGFEVQKASNVGSLELLNLVDYTTENAITFSLLPAIKVNKTSLVYARLGKGSVDVIAISRVTGAKEKDSVDYTTVGIGYKSSVVDNLSLSIEYTQNTGSKSSVDYTADYTASIFSVGAQYNF